MTPFGEAQALIGAACAPLGSERVASADGLGRVLAHDVSATDDLVPFARSAMDGYAVCQADLGRLPVTLPVVGTQYAAPGTREHQPGTATSIATGAAIPVGADWVIPLEDVSTAGDAITIRAALRPGASIFPPGEDARRGDLLAARGTRLTPAVLGLLAAAGNAQLAVYRRPVVAVITGGDELVEVGARPAPGQIRDSNAIMLASALTAAGAVALPPVRLADDRDAVRAGLLHAFASADLVVTTGGASVGERDFIKSVCREIGVRFLFGTVGLRPAKPTAFGRRGAAFIGVLPGNPAAAFVALHEFVLPAVRALAGDAEPRPPRGDASLVGSIKAKPGRHFAAFAALSLDRTGLIATPLENQCSSLTRTAAACAGFIIVPPGPRTYRDGDRVAVDIIDWSRVTTRRAQPDVSPALAHTLALA